MDRADMTTTRETADHAELLEDALEALQIIDAFPSNQGEVEGRITEKGDRILAACTADIRACQAALLSEIAALRGERTFLVDQKEGAEDAIFDALSRATQAERQRDELRKALERLASSEAFETPRVIDGPLAPEMRARLDYARQAIANQGADPAPVKKERAWICPQDNTPCPPECDSDDRRHCASVACKEQPA